LKEHVQQHEVADSLFLIKLCFYINTFIDTPPFVPRFLRSTENFGLPN
jgi:hypothetical protein